MAAHGSVGRVVTVFDLLPGAYFRPDGIPTRLLDWTESPLAALYFSVLVGAILQVLLYLALSITRNCDWLCCFDSRIGIGFFESWAGHAQMAPSILRWLAVGWILALGVLLFIAAVWSTLISSSKKSRRRVNSTVILTSMTSMVKIVLVFALIVLPNSLFAQKCNHAALGWDLTYSSILKANHVAQDEWIRKWLGPNFQSPIRKYISGWNGEPIESSILIEHPAFHAGEHITLWYVRTKNHAYHWALIEGKPPRSVKEPLDPDRYDKFFVVVAAWQQASRLKPEDTPDGGIPGYIGFLSVHDRGHSRQMLLTLNDFFLCETKKCEGGKGGRLTQAMEIFPHD